MGVIGHAVEDEPVEAELGSGVKGPPEEDVRDHEGDGRKELEREFEVWLDEGRGGGEGVEEGRGGELVGALDAGGDFRHAAGEREVDDCCCGIFEVMRDEGAVCVGGEDGDLHVTTEEEAGEVEKG